jgi:predicted SAM-dependent methyltransferase
MRAGPRENSAISRTLPDPLPTKANLGCGYDRREGYLNVDLYSHDGCADLIADVSELSIFPAGHFEELIAYDVIEHFERARTVDILSGWARLLRPNGVLRLRTPSLLKLTRNLLAPENRAAEKAAHVVHLMYGTQAYLGDYHLTGFTPALLLSQLSKAGLTLSYAVDELESTNFTVAARKTERLTDPAEIVHNAHFRLLHRAATDDEVRYWSAKIGSISGDDFDDILRATDECRFVAENDLGASVSPVPTLG